MVELRALTVADKEKLREWRNSPEVKSYMHHDHEISVDEHDRWFNGIFSDETVKFWMIVYNGEDVGVVNLKDIDYVNKRCDWAFYIGSEEHRGKGIGAYVEYFVLKYVFEELRFNRIYGDVLDFNEHVVNIHKKFGFTVEGVQRQHVFKEGKFHDIILVGYLREDWLKNKKNVIKALVEKGIKVD